MSKDSKTAEQAALYALNLLTGDEKSAFEERLRDDDASRNQYEGFRGTADQLGFAAEPARPPASLRDRVVAVAGEKKSPLPEGVMLNEAGVLISSSSHIQWRPHPLPGVSVKMLFVDSKRGYTTALLKLDPGAVYPAHRHSDTEELFVLEGDFVFQGQKMGPGDYCHAETGSVHQDSWSESGGVVLALSAIGDKFIETA